MDDTSSAETALLVIDVQQGLFDRPEPVFRDATLLEVIKALVERAQNALVPVFYLQHENKGTLRRGSPAWQLHPALAPLPDDRVLAKRHGSAFKETALQSELSRLGITRIIVAGLVSNGCVAATCRGAMRLGYEVVLVADGHSTYGRNPETKIQECNRLLATAGVRVLTAECVASGLGLRKMHRPPASTPNTQ